MGMEQRGLINYSPPDCPRGLMQPLVLGLSHGRRPGGCRGQRGKTREGHEGPVAVNQESRARGGGRDWQPWWAANGPSKMSSPNGTACALVRVWGKENQGCTWHSGCRQLT